MAFFRGDPHEASPKGKSHESVFMITYDFSLFKKGISSSPGIYTVAIPFLARSFATPQIAVFALQSGARFSQTALNAAMAPMTK